MRTNPLFAPESSSSEVERVFVSPTGGFVKKWEGRMLNVHPSLLPSFKGANAHKLVLEAKVRISGCTVHFVAVSFCFSREGCDKIAKFAPSKQIQRIIWEHNLSKHELESSWFVRQEEVDAGAILVQESVPVLPSDTEQSLAERVKRVEHGAFPAALELVASGAATLRDGRIAWNTGLADN